ncbi:MAG: sulfite exporter TauE/SafE family protein [Nannocystaceae bacterium]|nr:sulfite exporter TauE/SafE family protein [Nannocystaceae bacterium]
MIEIAALGTVLGASLVGSLHCAGMCGPMAAVASAPGRTRLPIVRTTQARSTIHYNVGRLASYIALGLAAGATGALVDLGGGMLGVQGVALALAGFALIGIGTRGLWQWARGTSFAVAATGPVRWAARLRGKRSFPALLGVLTGLMPCGWLWAYVVVAAGTASMLDGALVMATFWLGTLPALALVGVALRKLGRRAGTHLQWAVPLLMLIAGGLTISTRARLLWAQMATAPATSGDATAPEPSCH